AALAILSVATPETLALAVVGDDVRTITTAPGVGKKLALRIILELKDKVGKDAAELKAAGFVPPAYTDAESKQSDAAAALAVLGYSQSEIAAAMRRVDAAELSVEEIIRQVLKSSIK
ncbi:MAG: Holliday junction branch migration protein RuvA, partial [Oscillospiraceae bacterium]|nr:Holliday junction branch migration protein RuvA [Oscillospiraceae bacterium]